MPNDKEFELDDLESFSFDDLSLDDAPPKTDPASSDDPLGVWVKSAPEDLASEAAAEADGSLPEEDFLSSEELADLDDSFDFVTVEEPLAGEQPLDDEVAFLDAPEAVQAEEAGDTAFDEVSLDDFVTFDDAPAEAAAPKARETTLEPADDELSEEFLDIDIDIDDEISDSELEAPAPKAGAATSFEAEDVDLAEFGDFEPVAGPAGSEPEPEALELTEDGYFEEEILDDGEVTLDLEPDDHTDMDHILALEEDLTSGIREPEGEPDKAAELLGKIEQELSSIKQEITELKREVTHLRTQPAPVAAAVAPPASVSQPAEEPAPKTGGFFDEEDDETIALTGDELDNILSTAEISEGEESGMSLDEDLLSLDAEGNLIEPQAEELVEERVTDEEFLAGTSLDVNEPDPMELSDDLGVPESIELEESLPEALEDETDDLLGDDFTVDPLPEGVLEGPPPALEIPSADDLTLEPAEAGPLAPELVPDELPSLDDLAGSDTMELDSLDSLEPDFAADAGWSPPPAEDVPEVLPPPPPVSTPAPGGMSQSLKDELRAVLTYMDKLLASLPDDKIQEFAESEHFETYKRLFEELGLVE